MNSPFAESIGTAAAAGAPVSAPVSAPAPEQAPLAGSPSAPVASQTAHLVARLRAAILELDLAPGEQLTERGLETAFSASRTPVRAALLTLHGEGLVQREGRNGRGWIVAPIDVDEIRELAELREAVETAAVRLAVARASEAQIDGLDALLTAALEHVEEAESAGVRAGHDFHVALAGLSGNTLMTESVRDAMNRLARTRWLEVRTPESRAHAWAEHRAVLDAVAARDADRAARLVGEHIRATNERLVTFLTAERRRLRGHGLAIVDTRAV